MYASVNNQRDEMNVNCDVKLYRTEPYKTNKIINTDHINFCKLKETRWFVDIDAEGNTKILFTVILKIK